MWRPCGRPPSGCATPWRISPEARDSLVDNQIHCGLHMAKGRRCEHIRPLPRAVGGTDAHLTVVAGGWGVAATTASTGNLWTAPEVKLSGTCEFPKHSRGRPDTRDTPQGLQANLAGCAVGLRTAFFVRLGTVGCPSTKREIGLELHVPWRCRGGAGVARGSVKGPVRVPGRLSLGPTRWVFADERWGWG